jgi:hypothetical protein
VIGYSFPLADIEHLHQLFVPGVLHPEVRLTSVNPSNGDPEYRARVESVFPTIKNKDFRPDTFAEFVKTLDWGMTGPPRPTVAV